MRSIGECIGPLYEAESTIVNDSSKDGLSGIAASMRF